LARDQISYSYKENFKPSNALDRFTIDCTGDICVGDVILITEQLFAKNENQLFLKENKSTQKSEQESTNKILGNYLGERSIAAIVLRDNYRTVRDRFLCFAALDESKTSSNQVHTVSENQVKQWQRKRLLWLEVLWQQRSSGYEIGSEGDIVELKAGDVIERSVSRIERFEVLRCTWKEESKRRSLKEEWNLLSSCFIQPQDAVDC
jgi:hypothetical protein